MTESRRTPPSFRRRLFHVSLGVAAIVAVIGMWEVNREGGANLLMVYAAAAAWLYIVVVALFADHWRRR